MHEREEPSPVLTALADGVLTVTLNRPHDHNRMDRRTMAAIAQAMDEAEANPAVRVIVVTGNGEYFCAGGRVDGHPKGTLKQRLDYAQAFCSMQERMGRVAIPVVAAVTGHCIAGGMSLLSFCDIGIAADDVEFGYPEVNYGQFPALALAMLIPMVPQKRAFDILYSGHRFSAREALEYGMLNHVLPRDRVAGAVADYARMLKTKNAVALGLGRRAYYAMAPMTPASRLQYAQTFLTTLLQATDGFVPDASEDARIAREHARA